MPFIVFQHKALDVLLMLDDGLRFQLAECDVIGSSNLKIRSIVPDAASIEAFVPFQIALSVPFFALNLRFLSLRSSSIRTVEFFNRLYACENQDRLIHAESKMFFGSRNIFPEGFTVFQQFYCR